MKSSICALIVTLCVIGAVCLAALAYLPAHAQTASAPVMPIGKHVQIKAPLGLPPVPIPADNPPTERPSPWVDGYITIPAFRLDGTISCASCHCPAISLFR